MSEGMARVRRHVAFAVSLLGGLLLASCERTPSKSDYVSAQVTALCEAQSGDELRACRMAVTKQFKDTPLEEMQRRFPAELRALARRSRTQFWTRSFGT